MDTLKLFVLLITCALTVPFVLVWVIEMIFWFRFARAMRKYAR